MRYRSLALSLVAVAALAFSGRGVATAQDGSLVDETGFPELTITLTDTGIEGLPAETAAGWHVVTFTNSVTPTGDPFEDSWGIDFVQLPDGMTIDDVAAAFAASPEEEAGSEEMEGMDMASPDAMVGMDMASPDAAAEDPFAFLYETYLPGGPGALQGETSQSAIYLEPGDYAVLALGFAAPAGLTVTESADASPAAAGAVSADATITETGTSGSFDFVADSLPAGPAVIEIVNDSEQPHFIFAIHSAEPLTEDDVLQILMSEEGGTPAAGGPDSSQIGLGFVTGSQSTGTTQYVTANLEPGYYALLCFVGDPAMGGVPHSFAGMIEVVPAGVDAAATPAA